MGALGLYESTPDDNAKRRTIGFLMGAPRLYEYTTRQCVASYHRLPHGCTSALRVHHSTVRSVVPSAFSWVHSVSMRVHPTTMRSVVPSAPLWGHLGSTSTPATISAMGVLALFAGYQYQCTRESTAAILTYLMNIL
ncbi:Hypothetical protein NTJ_11102 [Nesidiocoris tenuis]|uniref:Uncharacterized protein n=1 Tax=Nesidiocoris tenuis TaxID=355587 RepID=A0ABN7B697_9HEMI|nr:Hypothetical protein NTJ_11102 [Nesidiocoris tenuis]